MKIVIASGNAGKIAEFKAVLGPLGHEIISQSEFNVPEVEETGTTFIENAIIKARHCAQITKCAVIADDSGICVEALNGEPGLYSARYAGANATSAERNALLLKNMESIKNRKAFFYCSLVLMQNAQDPTPIIAEGRLSGEILFAEQGTHGFGYDPVMYLREHKCSVAELPSEIKNQISHRGVAIASLLKRL